MSKNCTGTSKVGTGTGDNIDVPESVVFGRSTSKGPQNDCQVRHVWSFTGDDVLR